MGELCVGEFKAWYYQSKIAGIWYSFHLFAGLRASMIPRGDTVRIDNLIILTAVSISAPSRVRVLRVVIPLDCTDPHRILIP